MRYSADTPPIAFLGVAESLLRLPNVHPLLAAYNIRQLRSDVVAPFYPLPVGGLYLVIAMYAPAGLDRWTLRFRNQESGAYFTISAQLRVFKASEQPPEPGATDVAPKQDFNPWVLAGVPFPKDFSIVEKPASFRVELVYDDAELWVGGLRFLAYEPEALTPERLAALRTDPHATKSASFKLGCKLCSSRLTAYTALDRAASPGPDAIWYEDLPDEFLCSCGKTVVDLSYLRRGFHAILGERFPSEGEGFSATRLYEISNLEVLLAAFDRVLSDSGGEPRLQEFIAANPVLLHMLAPRKLIPKAPILSRYQTDFAVLTASGELILVELESSAKRLLKRDGHHSAELTHAIGQVNDWLHEFRSHRLACLSNMGLKDEEVTRIRGLVIIGRESSVDPENLRRFKAGLSGDVSVLTYDDVRASLGELIKEMRRDYRPGPAA